MKCLAALLLICAVNIAAGVALFGQVNAALSPIPTWPADGNIPDHLRTQYVFLGPRVGEITVSYPASLDGTGETGRKTFSFELHNLVEPSFAVQMARSENGVYTYDYVLRNGKAARQAIRTWSFVGPVNDSAFRVSRPGWSASRLTAGRARQIALPNVSQVGAEIHFYSTPGNEIPPGSSLDRFHVSSTYSPGFTTAFVRSGAAFDLPSELPAPVADQIGVLQKLEWDSRVVVILGPRFPAGTSLQTIAADFHVGISRLVRHAQLNADSPFVKEALARLAWSTEIPEGISTLRDVLRLLPRPSPGLENEIANAMEITPSAVQK